jgi:hypothetical protein
LKPTPRSAGQRLVPLAAFLAFFPTSLLFGQPSLGAVQGTVTDTIGDPLADVEVSAGRAVIRSDSRGFFRIEGLRAGAYALAARLAGYASVRIPFTITGEKTTELSIRLVPSAYFLPEVVVESHRTGIYGAVLDSSFAPLTGATVQIYGPKHESALTESTGVFAFPLVPSGQYMVRVTAKGFGERRALVELSKGEGRQVRFRLTSSRSTPAKDEETALSDLGHRLSLGLRTERLTAGQLERYQSLGLCDIPRIREQVGRNSLASTTLIINGTRVISGFAVAALCTWRADEVDLVEFGSDPCRDASSTIVALIKAGAWCLGRARDVPRSIRGSGQPIRGQASGGSYVIIWEKR